MKMFTGLQVCRDLRCVSVFLFQGMQVAGKSRKCCVFLFGLYTDTLNEGWGSLLMLVYCHSNMSVQRLCVRFS